MANMDMDTVAIERFISTIESHPILYDLSSKGYHDQDRKNNVWRSVAADFNLTGS
jgi:hypothetical protein